MILIVLISIYFLRFIYIVIINVIYIFIFKFIILVILYKTYYITEIDPFIKSYYEKINI